MSLLQNLFISSLQQLRVLNVRQNHLYELPRSIGKLVHLKLACFAENCISLVKFGAFLRLPHLKDLCLFSNRLENKQELERYLELFKSKGKLLRLAENRASVSRRSKLMITIAVVDRMYKLHSCTAF